MTENPAETLRRAATLMRERAEGATPGPWEHLIDLDVTHGYHMKDGRHVADWLADCDAGDGDIPDEQAEANADHIAAWHPLVALAVVAWLEDTAKQAEEYIVGPEPAECAHDEPCRCERTPELGCEQCCGWFPATCRCWNSALAVARAYLGEPSEVQA